MAMRREQIGQAIPEFARAVELQPENADYIATLAWAKFCAAIDKQSVADETRKALAQAIKASDEAVTPRMCLGRVERMLGRDKEALTSFQQVLALQPHNTAAASEARVLEARIRR
jgi:cytochrome c-type biogenesis protein CcmH/NrfG